MQVKQGVGVAYRRKSNVSEGKNIHCKYVHII